MTEAEAKQRWCPFSRSATSEDAAINRCGSDTDVTDEKVLIAHTRCIASRCMAWRWHENPTPNMRPELYQTCGYCGLAGKP